jgi:hypothetical protein
MDDGQTGLRPESCWNDCLTRRKLIRPCAPSHVAYEVGAARQQTVRSPRTMDPHSQEWHRNREAMVFGSRPDRPSHSPKVVEIWGSHAGNVSGYSYSSLPLV